MSASTRKRLVSSRFTRRAVAGMLLGAMLTASSLWAQEAQAGSIAWLAQAEPKAATTSRQPIVLPKPFTLADTVPREFRTDWAPTRTARATGPAISTIDLARRRLNALALPLDSGPSATEERRGVRKGMLALGILGTVGVVAGAVAISQSNTNRNCTNGPGSRRVCNDLHTLGEVFIPAGAVVAGLGYVFAFRHAR